MKILIEVDTGRAVTPSTQQMQNISVALAGYRFVDADIKVLAVDGKSYDKLVAEQEVTRLRAQLAAAERVLTETPDRIYPMESRDLPQ